MSAPILDALSRLAARRFGSFADAATSVFDLLESASPGGNLVLGQIDWDEGKCRVIDARGDGVPRGTEIPLARNGPVNGAGGDALPLVRQEPGADEDQLRHLAGRRVAAGARGQ